MAALTHLLRTTETARRVLGHIGGAALAAIAGGALVSGAASAQPLAAGPATASDISPSAVAPGDLEAGDTISIGINVVSQIPTFNRIDGSAIIYDGQQLIGMATSVDISVLGSGGVVQNFSGTAVFNNNPNCNGAGPSLGSTSASWSGMSLVPSSAAASCTIAADVKLPDDIPPGLYTLVFDDLTGFYQSIETSIEGGVITATPTSTTTAFSSAIASVDITVVADTTGPDGSITAPAGPVAPGEVFGASVAFDEPVTGFDDTDLSVANGTVSNFVANTDESGFASSFSFDVTAGATGPVTIDVGAAAAQDAAGNDSVALAQASTIIAGELTITAAFQGDAPEPGETRTLRFTIQNSDDTETGDITFFTSNLQEELTGLAISGAATTNTCGSTPSGTTFLVVTGGTVAPSSSCLLEFPVTVPLSATPGTYRVATSALSFSYPIAGAGVGDASATQLTVAGAEGGGAPLAFSKAFTDDPVLPGATVTLEYTIVPEEGTSASALAFTDDLDAVLAGLAATGLPQTDVCGIGSTLSGTDTISLTGGNLADGETCTFSVTVQTPVGTSGDFVSSTSELTGNQNDGGGDVAIDTGAIASDTLSLINQVPQVTIDGPAGPVAVGAGFTVTIEFSEPVTGFLVGEIDLSGGVSAAASNLQTTDNEVYTATITPSAAGTVVVSVPAGVAQDGDTNDNVAATDFTVDAEAAAPEIAVQFVGAAIEITDGETTTSTAALTDFGTVDVATGTLQRTVRISNTGVGDLTIASIASTDTTNYSFGAVPAPIPGGGSDTFTITFDPTSVATHPATITINSDDADEAAFDFAITGVGGSAPEINVQGNAVNIADGDVTPSATDHTVFDGIDAGTTSDRVFAVQNLGGSDLTLGANAVSIINDPDGVFSVTAQPAAVITSGGSDTAFTIQAAPAVPGVFTAQVSIASDDADENPYTFAIEITATGAPEVDLQGNAISILSGDATPATADDTDFDGVAVGSNDTHTFTILNTGNTDLVLTAPSGARGVVVERQSGSTDFTISAQPGTTIPAGGSDTFTVQFAPSAEGEVTAVLAFGTNDADENPYTFTVGGEGLVQEIEVAQGATDFTSGVSSFEFVDNTGAAFGGGTVGLDAGAEAVTFTISNTGATTLTLGSDAVSISGANASDFTVTDQPDTTVAPAGSTTFEITFDPSAVGNRTATASIANDDSDESPFTFDITGFGVDLTPAPGFSKGFAPATVSIGGTSTLTFTIDNTGGLATITALDFTDNLPSGMTVASPSNAATTCTGGTLTAVSGSGSISYTGGTVGGAASCTLSVDVIGGAVGALANTSGDLTSSQGNSGTASDTLTVTQPSFSVADVTVDEDAGTATFTVTLSSLPATATTVDFATSDGTAEAGNDYTANSGTLNFAAGDDTETFTVTINDDTIDEAATETFTVTLTNPVNATIADDTATGTITDNDDAPQISIADLTVGEGDGTASFTVSLSNPSASPITVDFATANGTATAGSDYTANAGTLTFSPGDTEETATIAILDDTLDEADETFSVDLTNPANATISDGSATGTITDNDATPMLDTSTFALINEGGGELTLVADLSGPTFQDVIVGYATDTTPGPGAVGVATADDVVAEADTFTIPAGETRGSFTITIIDDAIDEGLEEFGNVFVTSITNATGTIGGNWEFEITDNDDPPSVSISDATVDEGAGTATFTVSLSGQTSGTFTVDFATADGTAAAGTDYTANAGTVTFNPLDTEETISVSITDDALDELDETFTVTLSNVSPGSSGGNTISDDTGLGTITDNDTTPTLSIADVTVGEGDGTATFTVSLSAASGQTVTVDYGTSDANATDPDDYTATSGTLTFTPGDTEETFTVTIVDDALDESDEVFGVGLQNATNASIADDTATGTITDNDAAPSLSIADVTVDEGAGTATFTVSLDAPSGQTVGVGYATADGTATAGSDFTAVSDTLSFAPGDTEETFTVTITDDALDEVDETFFVGLESATNATVSDDTAEATITDNDAAPTISIADVTVDEGDGTASFDVTLSGASSFTVTVDFATTDGTALAGSDYTANAGTLTFTPGDVSETVTVSITDDVLDEADEGFTVDLSNPANATIDDGSGDGTITDNDAAPELSIADVTISEDGGNAIFTVTQSAVSAQTVTVDFTTTDGTAAAGSDFTANSGSLTINPGDTEATVTVAITDDDVVEPDETFTVDLTNPVNSTIVTGTATGTITNDDAAPMGYTASFDADPVNNAGATSASFTFADAVVGTTYNFTISSDGGGTDVTGSGSVASASEQVTGIDVSGLGDGTLTLSVTLTDTFGNEGDATGDTTSKETSLPGVAITTGSPDPVSGAFTVTVTFDEDVTGFEASDLVVSNGTAGRSITTSASIYVVEITPDGDGTVTVDVPAGVAMDAAGNPNAAADQFSIDSDSTPPGVTISTLSSDPVSGAFSATFTFTEDVTGFVLADITVGNGTASDFVADSAAVYTATITPTADGTVTIDVAAGVADDAAGNGNNAATQFSIESDGSAPTVLSLVFSDTELRLEDVGTQQTATVTFSEALDPSIEPVLSAPDLGNLGDTISFVSGAFSDGNTVYTATFSVSDGGLSVADIDVAVNGATDPAGNVMAEFIAEDAFSIEMRRGGITVVQSVIGSIDGEFDFSGGLGDFTITTVGQTGSQAFTDLAEGEYAITLAEEDGFSITGLACNGGTTAVDPGTSTATVTLAPGDAVECSFEATADAVVDETTIPVTIPLVLPSLIDDPTSVSVSFPLTNNGGVAFDFSIVVDQPWLVIDPSAGTIPAGGTLDFTVSLTDAVLDLAPGVYTANVTVTQTIPAGSTSAGGTQSTTPQVITIPVTVELAPREGTLTLVATTSPSIAGEGAFTYSSDIAGLDGLTLTTVGGTASSEGLTVLRGSYQITQAVTEGWRLDSISCTGDTDGGSTFDVANGVATIDLDPEEVMVCTFANRRDEDFIREVTQSAIRSFMAARADQILNSSPDVARRMRADRTGATPNSFAIDMTENRMNASFSTSLSAIRQAASERENRMPGQETYSLAGATGASSLDVWFEASYSSVTDDRAGLDADTEFGMYAFGVDMMVREDILVGALVQFDQAETVTGTLRSQVEGDGWLAGPYMAARLGETLVFDARVAWGQSDNQVNPIGTYWDDFETSRWLAEANLVGDFTQGPWRMSPELGIAYFFEEQDQYTDSLGFVIPSQEITLGRITAGPEIAYRFETDAGGVFEPFIKLTAVYDYDDTEVINVNGSLAGLGTFRADARIGLAAEFANGGRLSAEAAVSGLGEGDFEANTGMIRLRLPLSLQ